MIDLRKIKISKNCAVAANKQEERMQHNYKLFWLSLVLGCPKMTQCLKFLAPWPDSGAKFLILMENRQKIEFDKDLGSPNPIWNFTTDFTKGSLWKILELKKSMFVLIIWHQWPSVSTGGWL